MTPQQIAREIDVAAVREIFRRKEERRVRLLRAVIVRLPQVCFWAAILAWISWATWSAVAGIGNGTIQ